MSDQINSWNDLAEQVKRLADELNAARETIRGLARAARFDAVTIKAMRQEIAELKKGTTGAR